MGYLTNYSITAPTTEKEVWEDVRNLCGGLFESDMYMWEHEINSTGAYAVKWYDHTLDMTKLSEKYPTVKFVLSGEGEEQGDVWRKIFLGGKMKHLEPEIVWPDEDSVEWVQLE